MLLFDRVVFDVEFELVAFLGVFGHGLLELVEGLVDAGGLREVVFAELLKGGEMGLKMVEFWVP